MTISSLKLYYTLPYGRGLGAVIQLLLEDACIPYEFVFIDKVNEWPSVKASWIASNYHFDCMPMIEVEGGKRYSGCLPIMRFLSKKIGKYCPVDDLDEEHFVDAIADYACDWFQVAARVALQPDNKQLQQQYILKERQVFLDRFNRLYSMHKGPYALGTKISYVDFYVYTIAARLPPNKDSIKDYPNIASLVEAVKARPNLQKYLQS
ncbi:hypothetical protein LRAMOSA08123 [Lichtheimia ramosa]|uniref:Glutathione S-transferase n=1 Tax=Lichtheimia ramosa TaxID=688394 RepID=A0A077WDW5_9FUNG|nr:hypothetical protein LRAMOSA08123 [Lichtheimia ramosa]